MEQTDAAQIVNGSERLTRIASNGATCDTDQLETLIARVADGDRLAFEEVYRRTAPRLFPICRRVIARRQEAEEALQDAYLLLWQRASRFDPARGSAFGWLAVMTRNAALDRLRSHRRCATTVSEDIILDAIDPLPLASETMIIDEDAARIRSSLDGLNAMDADFLRRAFFENSTHTDLALAANLPLGTVKSRIRRSLLTLRERLG